MPYIAHAGIQLRDNYSNCQKNEWHFIKSIEGIEYKWRLSDDLTYDVIGGLYSDRKAALDCAKRLYVAVLFDFLRAGISIADAGCESYESSLYVEEIDGDYNEWIENEKYFFCSKEEQGTGKTGPGVFEAENDIEEYADYQFYEASLQISWDGGNLDFENVDTCLFDYTRETQKLLNTVVVADSVLDFGLRMTLYCGLLEHLAGKTQKEPEVLQALDQMIEMVDGLSLTSEQKNSLRHYLDNGKGKSSSQQIKALCRKYAKPEYYRYKTDSIINKAYSARSKYSHGNKCSYSNEAALIKQVVLDVLQSYLKEKDEQKHA